LRNSPLNSSIEALLDLDLVDNNFAIPSRTRKQTWILR